MKQKLSFLVLLIIAAFSFTDAKAQYTMISDFRGGDAFSTGIQPSHHNLISDGTYLYGMCPEGGANDMGTVFKIQISDNSYTKILDFAGTTNGRYPRGSLISDGTYLYGTTGQGGSNDMGTVFKIQISNNAYTKIWDFDGATNGGSPEGSLISDGNYLYGMTNWGGENGMGTVFKIQISDNSYTKILDFAGTTNGSRPRGSLISDGTYLYGMTYQGGSNDLGTVFKIQISNSAYTKILDFAGATNGKNPSGSLISDGTYLYGMTFYGGANDMGAVFKIQISDNSYTKILDFAGTANGRSPSGSLISDGTYLYGMTSSGGANSLGTVFKMQISNNAYTKILDFAGATNGKNPFGSLVSDGAYLYGMTYIGGANDYGTVFKIQISNNAYTKILDLAGATSGKNPSGSLISDDTYLYGMTSDGGSNNLGTVFKIQISDNSYTKILDFAGTTNGSRPCGSLISDGTYLYGMTYQGGANDLGTVFKIQISDNSYTKILDFAGATNGRYPYGSLVSDGTFLYGMAYQGGANNLGTVFKIQISDNSYTKILDFAGATNGRYPYGSLVSDGTFLYGMAYQGGANNLGTVFKIQISDNAYTKILDFTGTANGSYPYGSLISDGKYLYGLTSNGGGYDMGTLFKIQISNNAYTKLFDFVGTAKGENPKGSLIFDGTYLYGTTYSGGPKVLGTVFKYQLLSTLTYIAGTNGTISGTTLQTIDYSGNGTAVTAVPNTGYHFVNWSDGSTQNPRTDLNVTANLSVTATFAINTYVLTYITGTNGTISGTTTQTVNYNANGAAVTAVPNVGYHFVNWSDGSTQNPRTDLNVTANLSVTANFAINTYTLVYLAGVNGTISGTANQTVNYNANGTAVTAAPNVGYHFANWSDGSTQNPRTDLNVTANLSVTANFAINTFTLVYLAGANGTISGTTNQTVNYNANGTAVTAAPNAGYHFVNWSDGSTQNPRTDLNVTANLSVTANFAINTGISDLSDNYSIVAYPNPNNGSFTLSFDNSYIGDLLIRIYSINGSVIKELKINKLANKLSYSIDLGTVAAGTYYIDLKTTKEKITKAIIIN